MFFKIIHLLILSAKGLNISLFLFYRANINYTSVSAEKQLLDGKPGLISEGITFVRKQMAAVNGHRCL